MTPTIFTYVMFNVFCSNLDHTFEKVVITSPKEIRSFGIKDACKWATLDQCFETGKGHEHQTLTVELE